MGKEIKSIDMVMFFGFLKSSALVLQKAIVNV
ncbi:Uncharacterised protein [Mycobacterium tuberculosis]|uniref:Uncharacterized protein n=1 Tax=Mycobacterium tuberculosis TaxID=1773 RepID=A0A655AY27_MYCTX|nr:Uncharacterised protein [Mycobacterium tuberculosis]CKV61789.1 Uncharacterised protein [Mycobacterium tuberculosis]